MELVRAFADAINCPMPPLILPPNNRLNIEFDQFVIFTSLYVSGFTGNISPSMEWVGIFEQDKDNTETAYNKR